MIPLRNAAKLVNSEFAIILQDHMIIGGRTSVNMAMDRKGRIVEIDETNSIKLSQETREGIEEGRFVEVVISARDSGNRNGKAYEIVPGERLTDIQEEALTSTVAKANEFTDESLDKYFPTVSTILKRGGNIYILKPETRVEMTLDIDKEVGLINKITLARDEGRNEYVIYCQGKRAASFESGQEMDVTIGREADNTVVIDSSAQGVPRYHLEIIAEGDAVIISDKSSNRTQVQSFSDEKGIKRFYRNMRDRMRSLPILRRAL